LDKLEERREKILTAPLLPLLIKTAIPTMIGMMVSIIYNLTDTFWIGRLGNKSMTAAIGVVFAFVSFIQAIGFWFGYGSGNTMSRLLGGQNKEEAQIIAADGVVLSLITSVIIMIIGLFYSRPLAIFIGGNASKDLLEYTVSYLRIMLLTVPFSLFSTTVYNQMRLCGNVKDAMIGLLTGMLGNILLDPVFVIALKMGITGAGVATLIGYGFASLCMIWISNKHGNIPVSLKAFKLSKKRLYHILAGGAPNFSRQGITSIASIMLNTIAASYGETLIAALTVAGRVAALGYMLMIGFGQGFQPICAMNYGAKNYKRVKEALAITVSIGSIFLLVASVIIFHYADFISSLLSQNADVYKLSAIIVRMQCFSLPFMALYALSSMFLQNVGRYFKALFISISRQGIFYIPLMIVLPLLYGEFGFYILQPIADILSVIFSIVIVAFSWKKIFE